MQEEARRFENTDGTTTDHQGDFFMQQQPENLCLCIFIIRHYQRICSKPQYREVWTQKLGTNPTSSQTLLILRIRFSYALRLGVLIFALDSVCLTAALKITRSPQEPEQKKFSLRGLGSSLPGETLETGPESFHTMRQLYKYPCDVWDWLFLGFEFSCAIQNQSERLH